MITPDRFSLSAKETAQLAYAVLRRYGHTQVDTDHFLLALVEQPAGRVPEILRELGVDVESMRRRLDRAMRDIARTAVYGGGADVVYITPRLKAAVERAAGEADGLGKREVSPEHLLLAIAGERGSTAAEVLAEFRLTRKRILGALPKARPEASAPNPAGPALGELLAAYDWFDHPDGPYKFVETHRDAHRSSGHWLYLPGAFSSFHKVRNNEELWLIHLGRIVVHVLDPHGAHHVLRLGTDLAAGERPVVAVPAGHWQAAELVEGTPFAFGTNVCAPAFSYKKLVIARREDLLREYPGHEELVVRLTRDV